MPKITRRDFVKTSAAAATGLEFGRAAYAARARSGGRPNVLFIMSDEHNAGVTGCYGNPVVQTRNLDRLAAGGVTFDAFYCNSPLCVPSRMALTAGKYVSRTGAWNNGCWLPSDDYPSIARAMTSAGYDSLLCGKMHYDATRRYGFSEIARIGNNSFKTGRGSRRDPDDLPGDPSKLSPRFDEFHPGESGILSHDRKVTAGVLDFLGKRKAAERPFFLLAGYLAPHFPLIVPQEYWDAYKGRVPMPEIPAGHLDRLAANYQHLRAGFENWSVPPKIVQKGRELYHGLTHWFDDQLGKVLDALAASEVADNTVVVYTSDHGENMGEHGLWWKNCMYEHAARVPLIVNWPERFTGGQRRTEACSMVDLVKTVCELGGAAPGDDWNGDSLVPWLDDAEADWKDFSVTEYYAHNIASGYVMARSGRYKYTYHTRMDERHPPTAELYDLQSDAGEFTNLAADPAHGERVASLHARLVAEVGEDPDETELRCRHDGAQGYGRKRPGGGKKQGK